VGTCDIAHVSLDANTITCGVTDLSQEGHTRATQLLSQLQTFVDGMHITQLF